MKGGTAMYKFLSKTWSYFMGLKDMFLLMLSILSIIVTAGIIYDCRNPEGRLFIGSLFNNNKKDKISYKTVKERPKMGFHIVETD
jgi:hypothetical protein